MKPIIAAISFLLCLYIISVLYDSTSDINDRLVYLLMKSIIIILYFILTISLVTVTLTMVFDYFRF